LQNRIDYNQVKLDAVGRWPGIFSALGITVGEGKHCPCPNCGGKDRFRFDDIAGAGTYFCSQCGAGDGWSLVMKVLGVDFVEAVEGVAKILGTVEKSTIQQDKTVSPERLREIFKFSKKIKKGDPVYKYLRGRGLNGDLPESLWYCRKCWEAETKKDQAAMIAVFMQHDGEAVTVQRTFIKDGKKMDIESPRRTMPPLKKMAGGAVRLYEPENGVIGLAEGVETAIGCTGVFKIPTWATLSATLLGSFRPPSGIKEVTIFSDNDRNYCGQKEAYGLANRLCKDIKVDVQVPKRVGDDWLDEIVRENSY